jgi:glycosyltransferase involved in cell wall biosynthesis
MGAAVSALSVLIPARNEKYLNRTVEDVLAHAKGDTDVIVVLDGAWPLEPLPQHPKVTVLHHPVSVGQRAATNHAARISTARYIAKLDAHCSLADGFDVSLLEAAEHLGPHVLQVPAQKNLHVYDVVCACGWKQYQGVSPAACPTCGRPVREEIVWQPRKGTTSTQWFFDESLHFRYYDGAAKKLRPKQSGDYPETMSLLGACWFLDREWFLNGLDGLDEAHGSWGQMGSELACKAWLSGGRVVCNTKTWYAHFFRVGGIGFPYELKHRDQEAARAYSRKVWLQQGWQKQTRPLASLVEQFAPVPGWSALPPAPAIVKDTRTAGIIYYSDCRGDASILSAARRQLKYAAGDRLIVAVTLDRTEDWGAERIILPLERGYLTMAKQILAGLKLLDTDVVFLAEHDCLYPPGYFDHLPDPGCYVFAGNTWKVDAASGRALFYHCEQLSGLVAARTLLLDHFRRRVAHLEANAFSRRLGFEPGKPSRHGGLDDIPRAPWWNERPIVDIRHGSNLTPSRWRREQFRNERYTRGWTEADEIPGWGRTAGRFDAWLAEVTDHG